MNERVYINTDLSQDCQTRSVPLGDTGDFTILDPTIPFYFPLFTLSECSGLVASFFRRRAHRFIFPLQISICGSVQAPHYPWTSTFACDQMGKGAQISPQNLQLAGRSLVRFPAVYHSTLRLWVSRSAGQCDPKPRHAVAQRMSGSVAATGKAGIHTPSGSRQHGRGS